MPGNRSDRLTARPLWQSPPSFYLALAPPVSPVGVSSVAGNRYPLSPTRGVFFSRVAFRGEVVSYRRPVGNRSGSGRRGAISTSGRSHGLRATRSRASESIDRSVCHAIVARSRDNARDSASAVISWHDAACMPLPGVSLMACRVAHAGMWLTTRPAAWS